ncbi:hypothetical protein M445_05565 [Vibrio owensii 47666-1]|uniref:Flp family type IVb pilin n=1 Tax=Vibrio owensii TaxID=696485 RepID=UPI0005857175|nr:Flp family type IVb pilin [Vibrio owensii]KIF48808.1 hypothetical protein M445_05565 [Vibrio owensii 47666-1]
MFNKVIFKTLAAIESFKNDQRGVTAIEYAVIAVAISTMMLTIFGTDNGLTGALDQAMDKVTTNLTGATSGGTTEPEAGI